MMDLIEIVIATRQHVPKENEGGHTGSGNNLSAHILVNATGRDGGQVAQKSVGGAVFDPMYMYMNIYEYERIVM